MMLILFYSMLGSEAGGRIFYPVDPQREEYSGAMFNPVSYDGASDLSPFGIVEDMDWRHRMERPDAAGADGYDREGSETLPVVFRKGLLWEFARNLEQKGYVLDTKGYSTCFRVNRKQQTSAISDEDFDALASGKVSHPAGLATSTNLGCVDFYPVESGKKNW